MQVALGWRVAWRGTGANGTAADQVEETEQEATHGQAGRNVEGKRVAKLREAAAKTGPKDESRLGTGYQLRKAAGERA